MLYYAPKGFPYFVPTRFSAARTAERLGGVYRFLVHKWYFDELYWAVFVRPCLAIARFCHQIDKVLIDGLVDGSAAATALLSRLDGVFDMIAVDSAGELDRQGRLYGRRLEPLDPDRPPAQLPDVPGRALGGPLRRSLRLDQSYRRPSARVAGVWRTRHQNHERIARNRYSINDIIQNR